jgi:hypothetical protein
MTLYELLLFIHVGGSIVWIGAYLTFALVVLDMVVKPTGDGDDGGVLIAMALILAAGIAYILVSLRAIDARAAQPSSA